MIRYNFGDVLLIQFPFSDTSRGPKRPAVVLHDNGDQDVLLCRVTTRSYFSNVDFEVSDWKSTGLLKKSYVRVAKMATLEKDIVNRKLGMLIPADLTQTRNILKEMFEL